MDTQVDHPINKRALRRTQLCLKKLFSTSDSSDIVSVFSTNDDEKILFFVFVDARFLVAMTYQRAIDFISENFNNRGSYWMSHNIVEYNKSLKSYTKEAFSK